jgi:Domain of unknown function (DUF4280)
VAGNLVCTGASLQCSFGTTPAAFAASGADVSATDAAGVVTDVGEENVPPFGLCSSLANPAVAAANSPQPCVPVLSPWTPGAARVTIGEVSALDDASQCNCSWGGVVTVSSAGQLSASAS